MRNAPSPAKNTAFTGMLFALALSLSYLESLTTPLLGLPPGVKLGLANIVVMYALLALSRRQALLLVVLKAGFALLVRGLPGGALSLAGGLLSLGVMVLLMLPKHRPSVWLLSIAGAICHNLGQLVVVQLWMGGVTFYYMPVLLLSGVAMGTLCALLLRTLLPAMEKFHPYSGNKPPPQNEQ